MGYGWNEEKDANVVYREHLSGHNPKEITQEFKIIQSQNQRCEKNTLSFILSPTIKDGQDLKDKQLKEITQRFVSEMKLQERQAIAFVHRDKQHVHIHLYVNRIGFDGKAYKDSFIGKRSQLAAEKVAREMGLTTVREVQQQKLDQEKTMRMILKRMHDKVIGEAQPRDFDQYINSMKQFQVTVTPCINKQNKLQGFRFEFGNTNLKGSEIHRSMSMGKIAEQIGFDRNVVEKAKTEGAIKLLDRSVNVTPNLATKIAAKVVKQAIKRTIDRGIGIGIEI
jgi:hypothetical protein